MFISRLLFETCQILFGFFFFFFDFFISEIIRYWFFEFRFASLPNFGWYQHLILDFVLSDDDDYAEDSDEYSTQWPTKNGRKKRVVFPQYDLDEIRLHFKELIEGSPRKKIRISLFNEILSRNATKRLQLKYQEETLLSKVRTERKKFVSRNLHAKKKWIIENG